MNLSKLPIGINGSTKELMQKSDRAKLNIKTFSGVCSSLVHKIAPIIKRFPLKLNKLKNIFKIKKKNAMIPTKPHTESITTT